MRSNEALVGALPNRAIHSRCAEAREGDGFRVQEWRVDGVERGHGGFLKRFERRLRTWRLVAKRARVSGVRRGMKEQRGKKRTSRTSDEWLPIVSHATFPASSLGGPIHATARLRRRGVQSADGADAPPRAGTSIQSLRPANPPTLRILLYQPQNAFPSPWHPEAQLAPKRSRSLFPPRLVDQGQVAKDLTRLLCWRRRKRGREVGNLARQEMEVRIGVGESLGGREDIMVQMLGDQGNELGRECARVNLGLL